MLVDMGLLNDKINSAHKADSNAPSKKSNEAEQYQLMLLREGSLSCTAK